MGITHHSRKVELVGQGTTLCAWCDIPMDCWVCFRLNKTAFCHRTGFLTLCPNKKYGSPMMRLSVPSWSPLPAHMQTHMTAAHAGQVLRAILLIQTELCCQLLVNLLSAEYCLVFFSHTWTLKKNQFLNYLYLAKVTCAVPYHLIEKHWWWGARWGTRQVAVTFSK